MQTGWGKNVEKQQLSYLAIPNDSKMQATSKERTWNGKEGFQANLKREEEIDRQAGDRRIAGGQGQEGRPTRRLHGKRKAPRSAAKKSSTRSVASKRATSSKRAGSRAGGKSKSAARSTRPKTAATSAAPRTTDSYSRMGTYGTGGLDTTLPSEPRSTDHGSTYAMAEPLGKTTSAQQPEYEQEIEEEDEFESEETGGL